MTWRMPGSKPWVQTTMGFTQTADWEESFGGGVIRYDDGTLWVWNVEMAHPSQDYEFTGYTVSINELAPGAKAWEQLTPDSWSTDTYLREDQGGEDLADSGRLIEDGLLLDAWSVANDGGDITYWFSQNRRPANAPLYTDHVVFIVNKATRTWQSKLLGEDLYITMGAPVLWDGYLWFVGADGPTYNDCNAILFRMSTVHPFPLEEVATWPSLRSTVWDNDPATNLPKFLSGFMFGKNTSENIYAIDDGYLYHLTNEWTIGDYGSESKGMSVIRRLLIPDGEWETLYYHHVPSNTHQAYNFTYNLPNGGKELTYQVGPLPIGLGMRPKWGDLAKVRDGYLYWVDASAFQYVARGQFWSGGHMFQRLDLNLLEGGWVQHQPENPIIEVLSMTTGAWDSFYNWDDNDYWGTRGGHDWRDGLNAIHAFPEPNWQFDDDGSIIFLHHEYPSWYLLGAGWYPVYVLSRLSPPENIPITFNLVFEGNELKGYGHVRSVPAKTNIGTIELTGDE